MYNSATDHIIASLNPQQREAVTHGDGPLLIFAGAGSGKTRVLTHRVAYLIQTHGVRPEQILAVTFTNKAAHEMQGRIGRMLGHSVRGMWVGTFHAICARILREYGEAIGVPKDFIIFDADDQMTVIRSCYAELELDPKHLKHSTALNYISTAKNELITPENFGDDDPHNPRKRTVGRIYTRYQRKLEENHGLDFDDLIMKTEELLRRQSALLCELQECFRYIFVDEYQDINKAQYAVIALLARRYRNICVVGDDDQSIYAWRGADMRLLLQFEKDYPDAHVVKLEQNYRSPQSILDAAYSVISQNKQRKEKKLWTEQEGGERVKLYSAVDEHDEAAFIARTITEMKKAKRPYRDIAVLYRINALSRILEQAMIGHGIPYRIVGGFRFFERKEIKDILAYLRVLYNPFDSISLRRIINVPTRGIGDSTVARLAEMAETRGIGLLEMLLQVRTTDLPARAKSAVAAFADIMRKLLELSRTAGITQLTEAVMKESGYEQALEEAARGGKGNLAENKVQAGTQLENIHELLSATKEFEEEAGDDEGRSLHAFLETAALSAERAVVRETDDAITLMTLHGAKGLEFPVVFMAGMEEGIFPLQRMGWDTAPVDIEEERRLCYVGITRAREVLICSLAGHRLLYGQSNNMEMSQFLRQIPDRLLEPAEPGRMPTRLRYERWEEADSTTEAVEIPTRPVQSAPREDDLDFEDIVAHAAAVTARKQAAQEESALILNAARARDNVPPPGYHPGDRVRHNVFGEGIVLSVEAKDGATRVTVHFKGAVGMKKLDLAFAPLEKL